MGNPVIKPIPELYETLDWRDPYVFYNEDDDCYWILISGRLKEARLQKQDVLFFIVLGI
mgnify:CR=1 FL=1